MHNLTAFPSLSFQEAIKEQRRRRKDRQQQHKEGSQVSEVSSVGPLNVKAEESEFGPFVERSSNRNEWRSSPVHSAPPLPEELHEPILHPAPPRLVGPTSLSMEEDALMASLARLDDRLKPREEAIPSEPTEIVPINNRTVPTKPKEPSLGELALLGISLEIT